jgi:lipopolysaccharide biosynthesis glycosyltransferase
LIPFFSAVDEKYLFPTKIMLKSLDCNLATHHDFYLIVAANESLKISHELNSINLTNLRLKFFIFENKILDGTDMTGIMHFSSTAIYRLYAASLFPEEINEVIYLDNDILVRKPIAINNFPKTIFAAYVEPEPAPECLKFKNYFNSGVFKTNLSYWREIFAEKQMLEFLVTNTHSVYKDQDALNFLFSNFNTEPLDLNLNFMPDKIVHKNKKSIDPIIVHFAGHKKPWKRSTLRTKYTKEWQEFANLHFGVAINEKKFDDYFKKFAYGVQLVKARAWK